jgi:hypothetical protein
MHSSQKDFDLTDPVAGHVPVTIEVKGIVVKFRVKGDPRDHFLSGVPSFKTNKTAFAWRDPKTGKLMARPLTQPHHKKWMELAIRSIELSLRSAFGITDEKIQTVASPRSWIATKMPLDDSWTWCPEILVRSRLCGPNEEEGATIEITRIS